MIDPELAALPPSGSPVQAGERPRRARVLRAFRLVEAVQVDDAPAARDEIAALLAQAEADEDVTAILTLLYAQAVDACEHRPEFSNEAVNRLIRRAEAGGDGAMWSIGLSLRADLALRDGDLVRHGMDVAKAVVLLDTPSDPLARASAYVAAAVAYAVLGLWELENELYAEAEQLLPECDDDVLVSAIALNRRENWFWWTASLLEIGEGDQALTLLMTEATEARPVGAWGPWGRVAELAPSVMLGHAAFTEVAELGALLVPISSQVSHAEAAARMIGHIALAHHALHRRELDIATAHAQEVRDLARVHGNGFERSIGEWTAMRVEAERDPEHGQMARAYAALLARQHWDERQGRLASARAHIHAERLKCQHEGLIRRTLEDPLTGLGNRRAFEDRLARERAELHAATPIGVLLIDVDHFKAVNDTFGHVVGDEVLRRLAALLRGMLRPTDAVLRLGGDEFAAILSGAPPAVMGDRAARLVALASEEDWSQIRAGLRVSVSVGAACGVGPKSVDTLYDRADEALYAAKAAGRGRHALTMPG